MGGLLLPLAHAGEGAAWQALLTLLALGLAAVVLLVVVGALRLEEPGDLILPLAGTAVLASLSGATSAVLSDWVGWAFPVGVVALVALVAAAVSPLRLAVTSPLLWGAVVIAAVGAVTLQTPLKRAWHPTTLTPQSAAADDLEVAITSPEDGATISAGTVALEVTVTGGSLGTRLLAGDASPPEDPEEQIILAITWDSPATGEQQSMAGVTNEDCSTGCEVATYDVDLPAGEWTLYAEARTADGRPFGRAQATDAVPADSITVTAE